MATHSSVAKRVRLHKERHPDEYCPRCLWHVGRNGPCPRHMGGDDHEHCYCRSKTVYDGPHGLKTRRVRYCCWCGAERGKREGR